MSVKFGSLYELCLVWNPLSILCSSEVLQAREQKCDIHECVRTRIQRLLSGFQLLIVQGLQYN